MKAYYAVKVIGFSIFDGKKVIVDLNIKATTKEVMQYFRDAGLTEVKTNTILKRKQKKFYFDVHRLEKLEDKYFFRVGEFKSDLHFNVLRLV